MNAFLFLFAMAALVVAFLTLAGYCIGRCKLVHGQEALVLERLGVSHSRSRQPRSIIGFTRPGRVGGAGRLPPRGKLAEIQCTG